MIDRGFLILYFVSHPSFFKTASGFVIPMQSNRMLVSVLDQAERLGDLHDEKRNEGESDRDGVENRRV